MRERLKSVTTALLTAGAVALAPAAGLCADVAGWPVYGQNDSNTRFSPLKQINEKNVGKLKLAYSFSLASLRSNKSTPLVIGDTMYVTSSWGPKFVYALNAATGDKKWVYEPEIPDDVMQYGCCDVQNRGAAYADGKLFIGRLDGKLTALDAATGKELWTADVVDYKQGSVITSPPLVVKNKVITGFGGGEYGARGSLQAYDANTGKELWKTYTVPGPGETGNDSWKGDTWKHGGAAAWLVGSYDPETNLVLFGTSNPSPWNAAIRSTGTGDYGKLTNLYSASTVALDADTGEIKWHLQGTPANSWDYDGVNEAVLADLTIGGEKSAGDDEGRPQRLLLCRQPQGRKGAFRRKIRAHDLGFKVGRCNVEAGRRSARRASPGKPGKEACRTSLAARTGSPCPIIRERASSTFHRTMCAWIGPSATRPTKRVFSFLAQSSRRCLGPVVIWVS